MTDRPRFANVCKPTELVSRLKLPDVEVLAAVGRLVEFRHLTFFNQPAVVLHFRHLTLWKQSIEVLPRCRRLTEIRRFALFGQSAMNCLGWWREHKISTYSAGEAS